VLTVYGGLHHQGITLMMEAVNTSQTSLNYHTTRRSIPEDSHLLGISHQYIQTESGNEWVLWLLPWYYSLVQALTASTMLLHWFLSRALVWALSLIYIYIYTPQGPDYGHSKHFWNVGKLLPDNMVHHSRRQSSSYSLPEEPEISHSRILCPCNEVSL
jgi:hypothetical protein